MLHAVGSGRSMPAILIRCEKSSKRSINEVDKRNLKAVRNRLSGARSFRLRTHARTYGAIDRICYSQY